MNINTAFPSTYLKADDLQGKVVNVVVSGCKVEPLGDGTDTKPVLYFQGKEKGLVLNKTNASVLAHVYGPETDGWVGKPLQVFPTQTSYQGRTVDCLRVRVVPGVAAQPAPAPAPMAADFGDDIDPEDIPF